MSIPQETEVPVRDYRFDNLKTLLIFLVVMGHLLEYMKGGVAGFLYDSIYLFHMPLFVFCTGYFSKYSPRKILTSLVWPYLVFQLLYLLFARFVLGAELPFRFTTPYWIMWYLFSAVVWHLLIPLLEAVGRISGTLLCLLLFAAGLAIGFDDSVGYSFSISRTFVFFPFFALGRVAVENRAAFLKFIYDRRVRIFFAVASVGIIVAVYFFRESIDRKWLYGAMSYSAGKYSVFIRAALYAAAVVIGVFLLSVMPKKYFWFTYAGANSLTVYLLHGFVMRLVPRLSGVVESPVIHKIVLFGGGLGLVFILSLPAVRKILAPLLQFPFGGGGRNSR